MYSRIFLLLLVSLVSNLTMKGAESRDTTIVFTHPTQVKLTHQSSLLLISIKHGAQSFDYVGLNPQEGSDIKDSTQTYIQPDSVWLSERADSVYLRIKEIVTDTTYLHTFLCKKYCQSLSDNTGYKQMDKCKSHALLSNFGKSKQAHKSGFYFGGIDLGFVLPVNPPSDMNTDMGASMEIGFTPITYRQYTRSSRNQYFSIGLAFDWRNYRMNGRSRFTKDEYDNLIITSYPADATQTISSRVKVFSIGFPFKYAFCLPKNWSISLGAILNFNTFASAESRYKIADVNVTHNVKESYTNIHQKSVSVDFMTQVGWHKLGFYAKYSPCKVLNSDFGPSFSSFSVGLSLFF